MAGMRCEAARGGMEVRDATRTAKMHPARVPAAGMSAARMTTARMTTAGMSAAGLGQRYAGRRAKHDADDANANGKSRRLNLF